MNEDRMTIMGEVSKAIDLANDLKEAKRIALEELGDASIDSKDIPELKSALADNRIIQIIDGLFDARGGNDMYTKLYCILKF